LVLSKDVVLGQFPLPKSLSLRDNELNTLKNFQLHIPNPVLILKRMELTTTYNIVEYKKTLTMTGGRYAIIL